MDEASSERRVAAIVVHYRGLDETRACLRSLEPSGVPVLVVDNSPAREALSLAQGSVRVIDAGANLGWAGGNNLGIRAALAEGATDILLLNPDATVAPGFLAPLLDASAEASVGIVTGKILLPGEPPRIWMAGGVWDAAKGMGVHRGVDAEDGPLLSLPLDVHWGSGAFLLVKKAVFDEVGLIDERFFLYMEDLELCDRARDAGFRIRYEPRAVAVHRVHGSVGGTHEEPGAVMTYYLTRNRFLYARQRLHGFERTRVVARLVATRALKALAECARLRPARAALIARAVKDGLAGRTGPAPGVT